MTKKAMGLSVLVCALGLSAFGLIRYSANASERLPRISDAKAFFLRNAQTEELYRFSMARVSPLSGYQLYEVEVVQHANETKVRLRRQKVGKDAVAEEYERLVEEARFDTFWQELRELETAQLTNLSPSTENIGRQGGSKRTPTAETYRFTFQDGLRDYPNSFEVYAPEVLEDSRYRQLRDLTNRFVNETFGETISD